MLLAADHGEERTPPEIDRRFAERLVHRHGGESVAHDAAPVAQRLVERLAEHEPHVLNRVVVVHVDVAGRLDVQIDQRGTGGSRLVLVMHRGSSSIAFHSIDSN